MQKWEYITIQQIIGLLSEGISYFLPNGNEYKIKSGDVDAEGINELLNDFGEQGYELVTATTSATHAGIFSRIFVLKRPLIMEQGMKPITEPP